MYKLAAVHQTLRVISSMTGNVSIITIYGSDTLHNKSNFNMLFWIEVYVVFIPI